VETLKPRFLTREVSLVMFRVRISRLSAYESKTRAKIWSNEEKEDGLEEKPHVPPPLP
jgi:hypothetical protein